jgi:hypothetical protein
MFTLIELVGPSYNVYSITLSIISDIIFIGALYWGHVRETRRSGTGPHNTP